MRHDPEVPNSIEKTIGMIHRWLFDIEMAWARLRRQPMRTTVSAWAVTVSVAAVMIVLGLGDGLHSYLTQRLMQFTPALWVDAPGGELPVWASVETSERPPSLRNVLLTIEGVTGAARQLQGYALVRSQGQSLPTRVEAYDAVDIATFLPGAEEAIIGRFPSGPAEVAIGARLARALGVARGDSVFIVGPSSSPTSLQVVGLIEAGIGSVDAELAIASFADARHLLGEDARDGMALTISPGADIERIRLDVQRATGRWVQPWYEGRRALLEALAIEARVMYWISLAAVITAAFATGSVAMLRVMERRHELAILQASGAGTAATIRTVLVEAIASSLTGALLGAALGWGISVLLARYPVPLPPEFGVAYVPVEPGMSHALLAFALSMISATLAALPSALRAAKLEPTSILRSR